MEKKINVLENWLVSQNGLYETIDYDMDIFSDRIIDSLHFVSLINLIEELTGMELDMEDLTLNDFKTLNIMQKKFNL